MDKLLAVLIFVGMVALSINTFAEDTTTATDATTAADTTTDTAPAPDDVAK